MVLFVTLLLTGGKSQMPYFWAFGRVLIWVIFLLVTLLPCHTSLLSGWIMKNYLTHKIINARLQF